MSKTWTTLCGESTHFGVSGHFWSVLRSLEVRDPELISSVATITPIPSCDIASTHYQCMSCIRHSVTYLLMITVDRWWRFRAVVRRLYTVSNFRFLLTQRSYYARRVYLCVLPCTALPSHNWIIASERKYHLPDLHRKLLLAVNLPKHLWLWFRRWRWSSLMLVRFSVIPWEVHQ